MRLISDMDLIRQSFRLESNTELRAKNIFFLEQNENNEKKFVRKLSMHNGLL